MNDLPTLQRSFQHYLLDSSHPHIGSEIVSTARVPAEKRLAIYAHAYKSRLIEVLGISYPVLQTYLGNEKFYELGDYYADLYPSTFRSIRWFGEHMASVLSQHPVYQRYPFLAELAQIEWLMCSVFDSPDVDTLAIETLSRIPPEEWMSMQLHAHPSLRRLDLSWNVIDIWKAINEETSPPDAQQSDSVSAWVFWRKDLAQRFSSIDADEAWAIDAILSTCTFGDLCEGLSHWMEDEEAIALRAASLLKGWILAGFISGVSLS